MLAESYTELGELIDRIGQKPEAREAYRKAVAIRRELAEGTGPSARVELARALNALGWEASQLDDHAGAIAAFEEARSLAEPLATGAGATIEARRAAGPSPTSGAGAGAGGDRRRRAGALAAYRRARAEVREPLAHEAAGSPPGRPLRIRRHPCGNRRPAGIDRRPGRGPDRATEGPGAAARPGRRAPRCPRIPPRPGRQPQPGRHHATCI